MATINGTVNPETLPGTAADDTITGAGGNDTALMGAGNDIFIWNPGDGSDVVEGGTGNDLVLFNGSNANEKIAIFADTGRAELTRDVGNILMDTNDVERLELNVVGGINSIMVNDLTGTELKVVAIDLSGSGSPGVADSQADLVTANASGANNKIAITNDLGAVTITGLPETITIAASDSMDSLTLNGLTGNDIIDASGLPAGGMDLVIDGGTGNDTILGSQSADLILGGDGNDTITGGRGDDVALMGAGNDRFIWNPGDGSDIIEGQADTDTLQFNGANINEVIDLSANGGRLRFTRDVASVTLDVNDVERVEVHALGGVDTITVNDLSGTDVTEVVADLAATLGGTVADLQLDTVIVNATALDDVIKIASVGTKIVTTGLAASVTVDHSGKTDVLTLNALTGVDTIDAGKLAAGKIELHIVAGDGDDQIIGSAGTDIVEGGRGSDNAHLGAGDDVFTWNPGDGNDTIDGGAGNDTLQFNGANINEKINIFAGGAGHAQFTRDIANILMDLDGVERIAFKALGGTDTIHVSDLSGTDVKEVAIDLGVNGAGDGAADSVIADASNAANTIKLVMLDPAVASGFTLTGLPYALTVTNSDSANDRLTLSGFGGNDTIDASALTPIIGLTIDGGTGNDTILGGRGDDVLLGGEDNDTIDGGIGLDTAFLGSGNDVFVWSPGDGSDVVEGQDGTDTLDFTGANVGENIDLSANGGRVRVFRDVANVVMDLDDVEHVVLHTLGGSDSVTVNDLTGTDVTAVLVDLAGTVGGAAADKALDTVVVNATTGVDSIKIASVGGRTVVTGLAAEVDVDHADATDILTLSALAGADTIDASKLAAGKLELHINGGDDDDSILGSAGVDVVQGGRGSDVALLGAGNDAFIWNPGDGNDTIDGGAGNDTLQFNGANINEKIDISANGGHARFFRDIANITMDLDGVETIAFKALGGIDAITINDLSGTDVKQVVVDLAGGTGGGDGAADSVTVNGSTGKDTISIVEDSGFVVVQGLAAAVSITNAEAGSDKLVINGLDGDDKIDATALPVVPLSLTIDGGSGNDVINGGAGTDLLLGGDGNDTVAGKGGLDTALLGTGNDLFLWTVGDGSDTVDGQADTDTLRATGSATDDSFVIVPNGARADVFAPGGALLDLNAVERIEVRTLGGTDTVLVTDLTGTGVTEAAIDLAATAGGAAGDNKTDSVTVVGALGESTAISNIGTKIVVSNTLTLQSVTVDHWDKLDTLILSGSSVADLYDASQVGAGKMALQIFAGLGDDIVIGGAGNDTIFGGDGNDVANLGAGNDHFVWNAGDDNDVVDGGAGNDTATFQGSTDSELFILQSNRDHAELTYGLGANEVDLDDVERVEFTPGGGNADFVSVGDLSGTDVKQVAIDLGNGIGSDGFADSIGLSGGAKNESVTFALGAAGITITGLPAQVTIAHSEALDHLTIDGGAGNDTINAGALKADSLQLELDGGAGNDILTGGAGDDQVYGGSDNDTLKGGTGDDFIYGDTGNDKIDGGIGNDTLLGAVGDDTITGGLGADLVRYTSTLDGHDVVIGFDGNPTGGQDLFDLTPLFENLGVAATDRNGRVSITDNGTTVEVAVDADGLLFNGFELSVATLKTSDPITIGQDVVTGG